MNYADPVDPADVELDSLIGLFFDDPRELGEFSERTMSQLPPLPRRLLAHDHHMTVTIERHHKTPVNVRVLETAVERDQYSRKILLTRQSDNRIVQFGIVRLNLAEMEDDVRREIESQKTPLGRVLVDHNVMREVKLLNLYRIKAGRELAQAFGLAPGADCFGRTALIYCNGSPAVELLEIVANG